MKTPSKIGWMAAVRLLEENIKALLFLLSIVTAGCGTVVLIAAAWVDRRVMMRTEPIREILVWKLNKDGDLPEYLHDKAKADSVSKATSVQTSAAPPSTTLTTRSN